MVMECWCSSISLLGVLVTKEKVLFRLIVTPCCGQMLCWVNPRLPNYCPECGKFILGDLRGLKGHYIVASHPEAWLEFNADVV
jgi:hypothetical protein